jgi:hypothetical protein
VRYRSPSRFNLSPFDLRYRVGELVQARFGGIEEAHDRVPANAATPTLDLRNVGRVNVEAGSQLVLRQLRALAQDLERLAEHSLVIGRVSQLSTFSHVGLSSGDQTLVPPRRWSGRGRGAEDQGFSAWATIPVPEIAASPPITSSAPPTKEEPKMTSTVTIPATGIGVTLIALLCLLREPVEAIGHTLTLHEHELHPEWFENNRWRFEEICRLLDAIGWDAAAAPRKVEVNGKDARTIRGAIQDYLPMVEQWLHEATTLRTRREHRDSVQAMWALLDVLPRSIADEKQAA